MTLNGATWPHCADLSGRIAATSDPQRTG